MSSSSRGGRTGAPKNELRMTGCVLVVDDEKNIRRTLKMVLEGEGATVLEASTGEDALEVLQQMRASGRSGKAETDK